MEGKSTQATALVETFEETGLRIRLVKHLIDVKRSQSYTRYYLAERMGGSPADMGWESQSVMLVPPYQLGSSLNSPHDAPLLSRLMAADWFSLRRAWATDGPLPGSKSPKEC